VSIYFRDDSGGGSVLDGLGSGTSPCAVCACDIDAEGGCDMLANDVCPGGRGTGDMHPRDHGPEGQ